jgi:hypothetical protein
MTRLMRFHQDFYYFIAPSEDKYLGYLSTYNIKVHHAVKLALEKDPHTPFYWKLNELTERVKDYVSLFYGDNAKKYFYF